MDRRGFISAATLAFPAISISREYVDEGGLMSYEPSLADNVGHAATYVAKIRKGANHQTPSTPGGESDD